VVGGLTYDSLIPSELIMTVCIPHCTNEIKDQHRQYG
jgi:hypothetical protein